MRLETWIYMIYALLRRLEVLQPAPTTEVRDEITKCLRDGLERHSEKPLSLLVGEDRVGRERFLVLFYYRVDLPEGWKEVLLLRCVNCVTV